MMEARHGVILLGEEFGIHLPRGVTSFLASIGPVGAAMRGLGMSPARLKAFVLDLGDGPDLQQARTFLERLGFSMFLEPIEADASALDANATIRVVEDYKPLDIESATMARALGRGIRARYPDWRYLIDGDGGDENLKDYPIEENPELTIRSVINNPMLYQEGWGVGKIKHSLTYSGGLSRSYSRTYATARHHGFQGFSPFTKPSVIAVAEAIPFVDLTKYDVSRLYELKGEILLLNANRAAVSVVSAGRRRSWPWLPMIRETAFQSELNAGGDDRVSVRSVHDEDSRSGWAKTSHEVVGWVFRIGEKLRRIAYRRDSVLSSSLLSAPLITLMLQAS
jgi:hypothetical protein